MTLTEKVAIVTGGTEGIGAATAKLFVKKGAAVVIAARNEEKGRQVESELREQGGEVRYVQTDVAQPEDVRRLIAETESSYGALHVLVNNAAVFVPLEDNVITELSEDTWNMVMNVNLTGVFLCTKYALPLMLASGGGSIISVSSTGGILGLGNTAYGASKAGVINLMKNVAMQFGSQGVRANTIIPSITETPMVMELFSDPAVRREWEGKTPVGRFGKPEEIARLALYLASDDSGYVTGTEVLIDGGFCAQ
jgi:NAD(P)-dependent dehydrogenase (short-subunit alcohol dehydrogenase family)